MKNLKEFIIEKFKLNSKNIKAEDIKYNKSNYKEALEMSRESDPELAEMGKEEVKRIIKEVIEENPDETNYVKLGMLAKRRCIGEL